MKCSFALLLSVLLAACQQEPSFDDHYVQTEKKLERQAKDIDSEMTEKLETAKSAGSVE